MSMQHFNFEIRIIPLPAEGEIQEKRVTISRRLRAPSADAVLGLCKPLIAKVESIVAKQRLATKLSQKGARNVK